MKKDWKERRPPDFWTKMILSESEVQIRTDDHRVKDGIVLRFPFDDCADHALKEAEWFIGEFRAGRKNHRKFMGYTVPKG